jgi:hypothetical protein
VRFGSHTGMQTRAGLLTLTGIEMSGRRFNSKMTCGPFSYTWWHVRSVRRFRECFRNRRRLHLGLLLFFLDANELRETSARHNERWYQQPKPPAVAHPGSRKDYRDDQKRDAHENVLERMLEGDLFVPLAPERGTFGALLRLRELARQRLWHQADVCSARATKTRAVEILCCALRTKHLFPASLQPSLALHFVKQHSGSDRNIQRFQFAGHRDTNESVAVFTN